MAKSPEAFRTISEVSALLEAPAHVLRFWESRFPQVKPVKRAGGRRYYRPDDVQLLGGIKVLLHERGMTIRGVQKILREEGVRHVASLAPSVWLDEALDGAPAEAALGVPTDADGVIVGPWGGTEEEDAPDRVAEEEDALDLLAEDDLEAMPDLAALARAEEPRHAVNGPTGEAPSPLASFIAGTLRHVAAAADAEPGAAGASEASPSLPPLPPGPPTPERAVALLRRADRARLRARADRIAPLLARLRSLQATLPRAGAEGP